MPFPIDLQKIMARTRILVKNSDFFTNGLILVKTFRFWLNPPPPIGQCLKEIRFFMASLIHLELGGLVSYSQPVYGVLDHGLLLTSYQDVTVVVKCRLTVRNFLSGLFI